MAFWRSRRHAKREHGHEAAGSGERGKSSRRVNRKPRMEQFEPRRLLAVAPRLVSIIPNEGELLTDGQTRDVAPRELTFRFSNGQVIDPATLGGIQIVRAGLDGAIGNGSDVAISPGFVGIGDRPNEVVARFAEALPDDLYQIRIIGSGFAPLRNTEGDAFNDGVDQIVNFDMDLGAQVIAVVPQPVSRNASGGLIQARNQIEVYFNNDDLLPASAAGRNFYQLIFTNSTATNRDDQVFLPSFVSYDSLQDKAVLTFANDLALLGAGEGVYRLRIGNADPIPAAPIVTETSIDQGATFASAQNVGPLSSQAKIIKAAVDPQLFQLELPGDLGEPGHRDIPAQQHFLAPRAPDSTVGTTTAFYNFKSLYGVDPFGNPLFNVITEVQKQRVREIFSFYSYYAGIQFIESADRGMTIITGDPRALDPTVQNGPGGVLGIAGGGLVGRAVMDAGEDWGANEFGGDWFNVAMHEIGHLLGLGHADELAPLTVMSGIYNPFLDFEKVFPGDQDIVHLRHKFRPEIKDIDVYRVSVPAAGTITAESIAERLPEGSELDSLVSLYDSSGRLLARNDDYFGNDSFVELAVSAGDYYVVVSSTGNNEYNLNVEDSGFEGTTQGNYKIRLDFTPTPTTGLRDSTGTLFDGDGDGAPGGVYNFWLQVATAANTVFVDKGATGGSGPLGSIGNPYSNLRDAIDPAQANSARAGDVLRVVGNGGADGNLATLTDNRAYEVGFNSLGAALSDGSTLRVPKGVSMVVDAGAIFKLRRANLDVGSFSLNVDRSLGSMQVLGTPQRSVYFTSYQNEQVGLDTFSLPTTPDEGDWGGLVFRNQADLDAGRAVLETEGIFLNYVNHADITYGGGDVLSESRQETFSPVHLVTARPTISHNTIRLNSDSAMSANPDSFLESRFGSDSFTADYDRIGPEVRANRLFSNNINALFIRIGTEPLSGNPLDKLNVSGRFDDLDVVHVVSENLLIRGNPGGRLLIEDPDTGDTTILSRPDARLKIDPGIIVKLDASRIETEFDSSFIAEGRARNRIIFTSLSDARFGGSGTFNTSGRGASVVPEPGDWGGLYFGPLSTASIDHALITFAGGMNAIEGDFAGFNAVEIHQAKTRITNSTLEQNEDGFGGAVRLGRSENTPATIFISGAQPIVVNNTIRDGAGPSINVNVNALNSNHVTDWGRSTGEIDLYTGIVDNFGPLIRGNVQRNNDTNGMVVRGSTLTTQSVWDDTDIVHVLFDEVIVDNHHTYSGLRLQSSHSESLVVKLQGTEAGFTATGLALDIDDRIGGSIYVLGTAGHPVVLASIFDDRVGAGLDPDANVVLDTNNDGILSSPMPGDWRSIKLERYSNDRNVDLATETEDSVGGNTNLNGVPESAQPLGELAPAELSGDDNRRLGFEVHGFLNGTSPGDVDVYSFRAMAGTEVWIDIDRTAYALDTVLELIDADGVVLARSDSSFGEFQDPSKLVGDARLMQRDLFKGRDQYGTNPRDAGMRVVLPGAVSNVPKTYFVRVRARGQDIDNLTGGVSMGEYQLQVRLREADEIPGSTVRFADIRNATRGIEALGLPTRSPLLGENSENILLPNGTRAEAQDLGNLLAADLGVIDVAGNLDDPLGGDIDWYRFDFQYTLTQDDAGFLGTIFDIDYADGIARPDTTIAVFDEAGHLIMVGRDSDVTEDQPNPASGNSTADLTRGSFGKLDAYAGPYDLTSGPIQVYYVAVMSNKQLPEVLNATYQVNPLNAAVRLEPLPGTKRIAEERIEIDGGTSADGPVHDLFPGLTPAQLNESANDFFLHDVALYVNTSGDLFTIDPYSGVLETDVTGDTRFLPEADTDPFHRYHDFATRNDGRLFTLTQNIDATDGGRLREISFIDGTLTSDADDEIQVYDGTYDPVPREGPPFDPPLDPDPAEYDGLDIPVLYEAMTFAPGSNPRARVLYAVGHIDEPLVPDAWHPGYPQDLLGLAWRPDDIPCYPNLLYAIAGDEFFGNDYPQGKSLDIPPEPFEREPTDAINHGCLDTRVDEEDGGLITGIAFIPVDGVPEMYAVTDLGHLFHIMNPGGMASAEYVATVELDDDNDPTTDPINPEFSGLTAGPPNPEGGVYEQVMFATTIDGKIIALNNEGETLPVFRDAASFVQTPLGDVRGLTFSKIDYNLWHVTERRATEDGHGIDGQLSSTRVRTEVEGGWSFYFGLEDPRLPTTISIQPGAGAFQDTYPDAYQTYDLPGGAYGTLTTQEFSLADYTATDKPTLYFNYLAQTEGAASTLSDFTLMRDAFRVYGTRDGANWILLGSNNSLLSDNVDNLAELPNAISATGGDYRFDPYPNQRVQELYDTQQWRQARVDLGDLAGSDYVRLRFDFSTAASMDFGMDPSRAASSFYTGETGTGGVTLAALPGADLREGELFTLQAFIGIDLVTHRFEFDSGFTLVSPLDGGRTIPDGETFEISFNRTTVFTFEFDRDGVISDPDDPDLYWIRLYDTMAAGDVAQAIWNAVATAYLDNGIVDPNTFEPLVWLNGARVNLGQVVPQVRQSAGAVLELQGSVPGRTINEDATPVRIHEGMTRNEVAASMALAIDEGLGVDSRRPAPLDQFFFGAIAKPDGFGTVRVLGYEVPDPGPLAYGDVLPGDQLVAPPPTSQSGDFPTKFYGDFQNLMTNFRGQNNRFEGVFVDDIVIGFAERGDLVVHANANEGIVPVPQFREEGQFYEETVQGPYQLAIRTASEFTLSSGGAAVLFESIDTNDRLGEGTALIAPAAHQVREAATFRLSDGVNTATFEFDGVGDGVAPGNVRILFDGTEPAEEMAALIRKAINGQNKIKVKADTVPSLAADVATSARINLYGAIGYTDRGGLDIEPNDSLSEAVDSGLSSATQGIWTRPGYIGDSGGLADVDMISFQLNEGDYALIDIDINRDSSPDGDATGKQLHSALRVFDENGNEVGSSFFPLFPFGPFIGDAPGEQPSWDPSLRFVAPFTGRFYVGVSSGGLAPNLTYLPDVPRSGAGTSFGAYQITIAIGGSNAFGSQVFDTLFGDTNPERQQGQIYLHGNRISDSLEYGIAVDADARTAGDRPHPGAPRNLREVNSQRLVSGITLENNIIDGAALAGILFSGDARTDAAVVFGRIINNTIYGHEEETHLVGIEVSENASPTLLNNIVARFQTGISVDASSASTVIGGTVYQGNTTNAQGTGVGSFPLLLDPLTPSDPTEPLFIDAPNGNFYLAPNSKAIDSSINSLQDRPALVSLGSPFGIPASPILAPDRDALGQLRVNDPDVPSPPGLGSNVFKDRGALDRADFAGPTAVLFVPEDNSPSGADLDPNPNAVFFVGQTVTQFALQLVDGVLPADPQAGAGVDDLTVSGGKFLLRRNGVLLTQDVDYFFTYDAVNNIARFTAAQGIWTSGATYTINANNSVAGGIRDVAGNVLKANNLSGTTQFQVALATADFGDAPDPSYPTVAASQGAVHVLVSGVFLGAGVTADDDGRPSSAAAGDVDDGVFFASQLFAGQTTTVSVNASTAGFIDAWIDFNRDGDWNDAGEQVFASRSVTAGVNALSVNVPGGALLGESFARFRFSTAGGLAPTGLAQNGEVEDYVIEIAPAASYSIVVTSVEGRELGKDLDGRYGVGPGSEVVIQVYVDDQRTLASGGGVRAAFADLVANSPMFEFIQSSLVFGSTFATSQSGSINVATGVVDEAGGIGTAAPGSDPRQLVFSVRGRVKTSATAGTVVGLALDTGDDAAHATRFYGSDVAVAAAFGQSSLVVLERPYQNPGNRFDVNNDGVVSGLDALIIINRLNAGGSQTPLPIPITTSQPPYLDSSGDGNLTALDVLVIINEINRRAGAGALAAQGDAAPAQELNVTESLAIAPASPSLAFAPTVAGAFLPTTTSVSESGDAADEAMAALFADDAGDVEVTPLAANDFVHDELADDVALTRPRSKEMDVDELTGLWIRETQDWTTSARQTIVEKRGTRRWL